MSERRTRLSRIRRLAAIVAAALALAVMAASVSIVPGLSGRLAATSGDPLANAFVAYSFEGDRFNFVDSLTYYRPGTILRTDSAGAYEVPGFIQIHKPLDSGLRPWIELVYAPELHHAFGPIAAATESVPGLINIDPSRGVITLADLTNDPERWAQTIDRLHQLTSYELSSTNERARVLASEAVRQDLIEHLHSEYRAFMERHSETPRQIPDIPGWRYLPKEEQQSRLSSLNKSLEREPLWGQLMERRWRRLLPLVERTPKEN